MYVIISNLEKVFKFSKKKLAFTTFFPASVIYFQVLDAGDATRNVFLVVALVLVCFNVWSLLTFYSFEGNCHHRILINR
jgi:hypothetical protein